MTTMNTGAASLSDELPPLPKPCQKGWIYDSEQMREYALAAIAAWNRRATPQADAAIAAGGAQEPTQSWVDGVAAELWKIADVSGFDDFKLAVRGFLTATALPHISARQPAAIDKEAVAEYRRGVKEAFHLANMINANRQGRTAEETCSYLVGSLATLANGGEAPAAPSVEQDERGAFEAWFKVDRKRAESCMWRVNESDAWAIWQARAASTSANVAQSSLTDEQKSAVTQAADVMGANGFHWVEETLRQIVSANVAQGAEAVETCKCQRLGDWKGFHHPLCDTAPPAQTALAELVEKWERWQADGDKRGCPPTNGLSVAIRDVRAILTAAQSASGDTKSDRRAKE